MKDTTYNGWANYATWRIQLEIVSDLVNDYISEGELLDSDTIADPQALKERVYDILFVDHDSNVQTQGMVESYAMAFLDDVDWYELAEHAAQEIKEAKSNG